MAVSADVHLATHMYGYKEDSTDRALINLSVIVACLLMLYIRKELVIDFREQIRASRCAKFNDIDAPLFASLFEVHMNMQLFQLGCEQKCCN